MAIRELLIEEFDGEIDSTRQALAHATGVPLEWRPRGQRLSVGELAERLARVPWWGIVILDRFDFDLDNEPKRTTPAASFEEIRAEFDDVARQVRTRLDKSDAEWRALWKLTSGGREQFALPRIAAFRRFVMSRLVHYRGQFTAYTLIANGLEPALYGSDLTALGAQASST